MTNREKTIGEMSVSNSSFIYDKEFLENYVSVICLESDTSRLIISPTLQGRVMTSSLDGDAGKSMGWINYDLIKSQKFLPHCNNFGGEDRYWIGPEGGQFSIFFEKGAHFDLSDWQTPPPIDTEPWEVLSSNPSNAVLQKKMSLKNYSGHTFNIRADREILLLSNKEIFHELQVELDRSIKAVGFKSINKMCNTGDFEWDHSTVMLSIWILGQFKPSAGNTVILPYQNNKEGEIVNDAYFGKVDDDRLSILPGVLLFNGDGQKRGKIGLGPSRVKPVIESYDKDNQVLTIVKFSFDPLNEDYVNSMWEMQEHPFNGDVVNSYNDGPLPDGSIMGPFYELETSSPAANLKPGETLIHEHATFHLSGDKDKLDILARKLLGFSIADP